MFAETITPFYTPPSFYSDAIMKFIQLPIKKTTMLLATLGLAVATHSTHSFAQMQMNPPKDSRIAVSFPAPARANILVQMRDHLAAISEIQELLAKRDFDGASKLAEQRLGMGSMQAHDHDGHHGHEAAIETHMPAGMRELGGAMHRAASRFATASQDAAVSDKVEPALAALSEVTKMCVACHTTYRVK